MVTSTHELPLYARRLKAARKQLGITQTELGIQAGIDESSASARINQYERGIHAPDFLTTSHLAEVLGVPPAYFFAEDNQLAEFIRLYGLLKSGDRKELVKLTASLADKDNSDNS